MPPRVIVEAATDVCNASASSPVHFQANVARW